MPAQQCGPRYHTRVGNSLVLREFSPEPTSWPTFVSTNYPCDGKTGQKPRRRQRHVPIPAGHRPSFNPNVPAAQWSGREGERPRQVVTWSDGATRRSGRSPRPSERPRRLRAAQPARQGNRGLVPLRQRVHIQPVGKPTYRSSSARSSMRWIVFIASKRAVARPCGVRPTILGPSRTK
jgi:hypothetical protein